jgi:hypothetical protein
MEHAITSDMFTQLAPRVGVITIAGADSTDVRRDLLLSIRFHYAHIDPQSSVVERIGAAMDRCPRAIRLVLSAALSPLAQSDLIVRICHRHAHLILSLNHFLLLDCTAVAFADCGVSCPTLSTGQHCCDGRTPNPNSLFL